MLQRPDLNSAFDLKALTAPCKLAVDMHLRDGSALAITDVVRVVPKKRVVCTATWHEQAVYVKFFLGPKAAHYAARDASGINVLQQSGIPTPALLCATQIASTSQITSIKQAEVTEVLIFKALTQAQSIESIWATSNPSQRLHLAKQLSAAVGRHHQANLLQTDLYFKNFLLDDDKIFTLDGDGIRQFKSLSKKSAIQNLSILLSKLDVLEVEAWLPSLLESYRLANPSITLAPQALKLMSNLHRIKVAAAYADKKVFRQCSDVNVSYKKAHFDATATEYLCLSLPKSSKDYDDLIATLPLLKDGNTCTVALAKFSHVHVVIKRYNIKNLMHRVGRMFRQTRAAASWANAHRLQLLGIPTPKPVALLEQRNFGLRGQAYFVSEYIDTPDVATFFANTSDKVLRAMVVKNITQLFYRLYRLKISHGDMKASNIKVFESQAMLIDLDSMQQHHSDYFAHIAHVRDLRRFMQNWKDDASLYNAFIKSLKVIYADHAPLVAAQILE